MSIVILVAAFALFVASVTVIGVALYDQFDHPADVSVPGTTSVELKAGDYLLWQESGPESGSSGLNFGGTYGSAITPAEVSVTSPGGRRLPLSVPSGVQTLSNGSLTYTGVVGFQASTPGYYTIRVEGHEATKVIVDLSWSGLFASIAGWIGGAVIACVLGAGGMALLIVMLVRASDARRRARTSAYRGYY